METRKTLKTMSSMDILIMCIMSIIIMSTFYQSTAEKTTLETYIVLVNLPQNQIFTQSEDINSWYQSFLPEPTAMVHSYHNVVSGFAAKLTPDQVQEMQKKDGFIKARPQRKLALHTTHTPNFLGLYQNLGFWAGSNYGKGVIIGLLDTGITPGHPSFDDHDVPPPPAKWKGKCEFNSSACNNKLIGARNFVTGSNGPPIDDVGHGTHTSSIAAGNFVKNANVFGNADGTAVGMAPLAHLAMYKVCAADGCNEGDILAAMDTAIADGVDVLSISLGGGSAAYYWDFIAIGAFGAIEKGVFVSCSAANDGPYNSTVSNDAPWMLTVGASTIDRSIRATAVLGNKEEFDGQTVFQPADFPSTFLPLVYPGSNGNETLGYCTPGSLSDVDVKGKAVLCVKGGDVGRIAKGQEVKDAGGIVMILVNEEQDGFTTIADVHVLPATHVSYADGEKIKAYINSTSTPTATIVFKRTIIGLRNAPAVAAFSSRGPSSNPGILKPDIIGPGVSILAGWPISVENNTNERLATFNIISGTSMSCPHLGGIAALLKSAHPDWTPAAIKSAIMTSATQSSLTGGPILDERNLPADPFAIGSGHVNPTKANDPGLVYDLHPGDYIPYLCGLGFTDEQVMTVVQYPVNCSDITSIPEAQLNYPSFSIQLGADTQTYTRTVKNVAEGNSTYNLDIEPIPGVDVVVEPLQLSFSQVNQTMTYLVSFSKSNTYVGSTFVQGAISWVSNKHEVRSPIAVIFV